jgi:hypothetical protein
VTAYVVNVNGGFPSVTDQHRTNKARNAIAVGNNPDVASLVSSGPICG